MLLRHVDQKVEISAADVLCELRAPDRITHSLANLVGQRLYGLTLGYEDLNDHDLLRTDPLIQTAIFPNVNLEISHRFALRSGFFSKLQPTRASR